ncbi:MAG: alpha/beta hydrolase, partial [Candidatus Nanopelagicales bacterium]
TIGLRQPQWLVPVGEVTDTTFDGPSRTLAARVYRPASAAHGPVPTVLFIHGGGHVIGDLDTHDNQARTICRDTESVVVSVEYRLAPEDPWPAAVDDTFAAAEWIFANVDEFGGDGTAIGVAGDSAGANLATVTAIRMRDAGCHFKAQLLLYPVVDFSPAGPYPSRMDFADGYFLTLDDMAWFGSKYAGKGADVRNPYLSPIHADLAGLCPAIVVTAEFDPLRDEGEAYAAALSAAGVGVKQYRAAGMIHGFYDLGPISPAAAQEIDRSNKSFAGLLH